MSMSDDTLILLLGLLLLALLTAAVLNIRHQQLLRKRKTAAKWRQQAELARDAVQSAYPFIEDRPFCLLAIAYSQSLMRSVQALLPSDPASTAALHSLQELQAQVSNSESNGLATPDTSAMLKQVQGAITELINALPRMVQAGSLSQAEAQKKLEDLKWNLIRVEAAAHLQQGEGYAGKGDKYHAQQHFKHAQNCLKRASQADPRRTQMMKMVASALEALDRPAPPAAAENSGTPSAS